jgi:hypothetical protein
MCASAAAGSMRIMLMPVDAWKTIKQARPCVLQRNKTQFTVHLFAYVFTGSWCGWSESSCVKSFKHKQVFVPIFTAVCSLLTQDDQCQRCCKPLGLQHVVARFPCSGDHFLRCSTQQQLLPAVASKLCTLHYCAQFESDFGWMGYIPGT